jgi:3-deoxy-7-phosphoheptulonate synthase
MPFQYIRQIPSVEEIKQEIPLSPELQKLKTQRDTAIRKIFLRENKKFILVIGPCSAHDENAVCEYTNRLAKVQEKVKECILIIPRIYTNKPRTTGAGYKGMAHQPNPTENPNMLEGLKAIRRMHIRSFEETGMPAADEMLYPNNYPYLDDVLSYVAIGARSVEDQFHRLTVSGMDVPAGMKNPTSGDLDVMLNSVHAAQIPQDFIYNGWEVRTPGNPLAHCILRGAFNQYGQCIPNYHFEDLKMLSEMYIKRKLKNPTILVDTNHANSAKQYKEQLRISLEIMKNRQQSEIIKNMVKGLMIESFIVEGAQDVNGTVYGQSITDPCIGWEDTENLIKRISDFLY